MTALMFVLAFLGGVLTIASPCILPVIPFVFARAGRPTVRDTAPLLIGLAAAFAVTATTAKLAIGWLVVASEWGRIVALVVVGVLGVTLVSSRAAEIVARRQPGTARCYSSLAADHNNRPEQIF